ncbi:MAG TPA: hypothetical protein EYH07_03660 [Kiloniellaceae bacterium]|nr:hypothetical protein [Kiloniellaceae bacterium]
MSSPPFTTLTVTKRELLLGALATAVALATPESRLFAASTKSPVKLSLRDGRILEVREESVVLLDGDRRRPVRDGVFSLAGGGRIEVRDGKIFSAAMGPGDIFVQATWIEVHSTPGGSTPNPGASDWLKHNAGRRPRAL